jgi:hypothetical protein
VEDVDFLIKTMRKCTKKAGQEKGLGEGGGLIGKVRSGLVETGEGRALPSHKILNLLASRKALAVCCGTM